MNGISKWLTSEEIRKRHILSGAFGVTVWSPVCRYSPSQWDPALDCRKDQSPRPHCRNISRSFFGRLETHRTEDGLDKFRVIGNRNDFGKLKIREMRQIWPPIFFFHSFALFSCAFKKLKMCALYFIFDWFDYDYERRSIIFVPSCLLL